MNEILVLQDMDRLAKKSDDTDKKERRRVKKTGSDGSKGREKRATEEHSFLTDVADVRQMEQGLMQLLTDFHSGSLQAFGEECSFDKMDQVREQQERLARLHFELDLQQHEQDLESREARESANKNLGKLMDNLQGLCTTIQNLQNEHANVRQNEHTSARR